MHLCVSVRVCACLYKCVWSVCLSVHICEHMGTHGWQTENNLRHQSSGHLPSFGTSDTH